MQNQPDMNVRAAIREMRKGETLEFPLRRINYIRPLVYSLNLQLERDYTVRVDREAGVCRVTLNK